MLGQPWWQHHEDPPPRGSTWTRSDRMDFVSAVFACLTLPSARSQSTGTDGGVQSAAAPAYCPLCLRIDGLFLRGKQRGSIRRALAVNVSPQRLKRSVSLNVVKHLYLGRNGVHDRAGKNTSIAIHHVSRDLDTFRFCRKDGHKYIHIRDGSCFGSPLPASSYI